MALLVKKRRNRRKEEIRENRNIVYLKSKYFYDGKLLFMK